MIKNDLFTSYTFVSFSESGKSSSVTLESLSSVVPGVRHGGPTKPRWVWNYLSPQLWPQWIYNLGREAKATIKTISTGLLVFWNRDGSRSGSFFIFQKSTWGNSFVIEETITGSSSKCTHPNNIYSIDGDYSGILIIISLAFCLHCTMVPYNHFSQRSYSIKGGHTVRTSA